MTDAIKQKLLDFHNQLRNDIALGKVKNYEKAANMATMEWDDGLAKFAEMNVRKCEMTHDECMNTGKKLFSNCSKSTLSIFFWWTIYSFLLLLID